MLFFKVLVLTGIIFQIAVSTECPRKFFPGSLMKSATVILPQRGENGPRSSTVLSCKVEHFDGCCAVAKYHHFPAASVTHVAF